jgi:hypothetical protein
MCLFTSLKKAYFKTVRSEVNRAKIIPIKKGKDLDQLPLVLKTHLLNSGYTGNEPITGCIVKWKYASLKMKPGKNWSPINCAQVNFIPQPARVVYMDTKLLGIFLFGALDTFIDGKGGMLIKLLNYFTIANATGPEMDAAELVTILAEAILIPAYFLQDYISLTEIDAFTIKATISYKNTTASGVFYFNEYNEFLCFESNDRCYTNKGKFEKHKWTAYAWNYKESNGKIFPSNFMAVWSLPKGDHTYFKGRVNYIEII